MRASFEARFFCARGHMNRRFRAREKISDCAKTL